MASIDVKIDPTNAEAGGRKIGAALMGVGAAAQQAANATKAAGDAVAAAFKRMAAEHLAAQQAAERLAASQAAAERAAREELATLQRRIALQEQVRAGALTAAEAQRRMAESAILAKTGNAQLAKELSTAQAAAQQNARAIREAESAARSATGVFSKFGETVKQAFVLAQAYGLVTTVSNVVGQIKEAISSGFVNNAQLETSRLTIASLLQGTTQLVDGTGRIADAAASWVVNLKEAKVIQERIAQISAQTLGTDAELIEVFRTALAFSRGQSANVKQILDLSQGLVNAGKLQGLEQVRITDETRQILTLEQSRGQTILALLGLSIQQARQYREQGTLIQELNKRLEAYNVLAKAAETSWAGLVTSVQTFARLFSADVFSGSFEAVKQIAIGLSDELNKLQAKGGITAAIGASDAQLQNLGRALADAFALIQVAIASMTNAVITAAAVLSDGTDAAGTFHQQLADLANFLENDLSLKIADTAKSIKSLIDELTDPRAVATLGAFAGLISGGPAGAVAGAAIGGTISHALREQTALKDWSESLGELDTKLRATAETNKKFNQEIIAGFGALAKAEEAGFKSPGPVLDALTKVLREAATSGAQLSEQSKEIVAAFGTVTSAAGPPTQSFLAFQEAAKKLGVEISATGNDLKRISPLMDEISQALQSALQNIDKALIRTRRETTTFLADATRDIALFAAAQKEARDTVADQLRNEHGGGLDTEVLVFKTNTEQEAKDARELVQKLIAYDEERTQEAMTQARLRSEANRAVAEAEVTRIQQALALNAQEQQSLSLLIGKEAERQQKTQEALALQQQLVPAHAAVFHSQRAQLTEELALRERLAASLRKRRDEAAASAQRASEGPERDVFLGARATFQNALTKSLNEIQDYQNTIAAIEDDIAANHGKSVEVRMAGENALKNLQHALTREYLANEEERTALAQEHLRIRADMELEGVQRRIDALDQQQGLEEAMLELRRAQGAGTEELIAREQQLLRFEKQRADEAIQAARIKLEGLRKELDAQRALIALQETRRPAAGDDSQGARDIARELERSVLRAKELEVAVQGAEGALANAGAAATKAGLDGEAGIAKLNRELALTKSVFTSNDARNLFRKLFDADSLKDIGTILQKQSRKIGDDMFDALLFGKKTHFDEPLIENVNGLFGVGEGGILGGLMRAGGQAQGKGWGTAVTGSAQQVLQQQFPHAANQALNSAQGVFQQQGQNLGGVFGENCLSGFQQSFGAGIGSIINRVFGGLVNAFSQGGSDMYASFVKGFQSNGGGGTGGGGFMDMFSGMFGGGGGGMGSLFGGGGGGAPVGGWQTAGSGTYGGIPSTGSSAVTNSGGGFGGGASSGFSYIGIATALANIGKNFSDGNYGAGAGGAVGGVIGAYFGGPMGAAIGAQLGEMIGKIFDDIFAKVGRIQKEKKSIIRIFADAISGINFDIISEKHVARGLKRFDELKAGALALGAVYANSIGSKATEGTITRFGGQFLGNLRDVGASSAEAKKRILELADAMRADLSTAIGAINGLTTQFSKAQGNNVLSLDEFQENLKEARKNLKDYGDTSGLTAKQLTDLALANGNTGSTLVTYGELLTGAIQLHTEFANSAAITVGVNALLAKNFLAVAEAQGFAGHATTDLAAKIRDGSLSLEEAAIAYNQLREAAGLARLELEDFTLDPEKFERFADFLKNLTFNADGFIEGISGALQQGLESGLDPAKYGEQFDTFWNDLIKKNIIAAIVEGFIEGLAIEQLTPLFEQVQVLLARIAVGEQSLADVGAEINRILGENAEAIAGIRDAFLAAGEAGKAIVDLFSSNADSLASFKDGFQSAVAEAITQGLTRAQSDQAFEEFFDSFLRTSIAQAVAAGFIQGVALEALKPFFDTIKTLFADVGSGTLSLADFGTRLRDAMSAASPEFARIREAMRATVGLTHDLLAALGLLPNTLGDAQSRLEQINDLLEQIADRRIDIEINFQEKLAALGFPAAIADAIALKVNAATERLERLLNKPFVRSGTPTTDEDFSQAIANIRAAQDAVRQLADLIIERFNAAKAEVEARYRAEIDAIRAAGRAAEEAIREQFRALREASQERVKKLQEEKEEIQKTFAARIDALQKELQLAQEFQRVGEQLRDTIIRLQGSQAAPVAPPGQLAFLERQAETVRRQLAEASEEDRPELINRLAEILQQQLSLGVFQRPSAEYREQFNAIVSELERLRDEALRVGGTAEDIQKDILALQEEQTKLLADIDARIDAEQKLQDTLSKQEQAAIAANAAQTEAAVKALEAKMEAELQALREKAAEELTKLRDQELELNKRAEELAQNQKSIIEQQLDELKKIEANTRGRGGAASWDANNPPPPSHWDNRTGQNIASDNAAGFQRIDAGLADVGRRVEATSTRQEQEIARSRAQDQELLRAPVMTHDAQNADIVAGMQALQAYGNDILTPNLQTTNQYLDDIKNMMPVAGRTDDLLTALVSAQDNITALLATIALNTQGSAPTLAASGFDGMVNSPRLFLAGEAGPEHVRITPSHQSRSSQQAGATAITIAPQVTVAVTITGVEKPDEIARKVQSTAARAATLAIEDWARSSRGHKIVSDIATQAARKVAGV